MKKMSIFLLLFSLIITIANSQSKTASFLEVREVDELSFKFVNSGSVSNVYNFLYLGNDNFFVSGSYSNTQSPWYGSCVGSVNFKTGMNWKHDFLVSDDTKISNLSTLAVGDITLLTATTHNSLNYHLASGEIIKTISGLSGYRTFFPFYENNLVITLASDKVYAHKINYETGALGDSFFVASSVSWIDEVKEWDGDIFLSVRKPDGGVAKTVVVKLNETGIIWQKTINKVGQSYLAVTPTIIYVVGDSIRTSGITSKLIALDSSGSELWRRSFDYNINTNSPMTMSRSVIIDPTSNSCVIGGYSLSPPDGALYIVSFNQFGDLLWDFVDVNGSFRSVMNIFWNEDRELLVCGESWISNEQWIEIKKYFIPDITMDVPNETLQLTSFNLEQNYPNPFNPSTTIVYTIPVEAKVTLKVYDVLGKEVATLINESNHPVGTHKVSFDGQNLPSGVYFYKINTPEYSLTKKMVYCK